MNFDDAIAFATDTLKADSRFKDVEVSEGSATYDMVILPFALMNKKSWDMVEWLERYLLFDDPSQLDPEQLDNIGKMLMAPPRRTESSVTVEVSLYFRYTPVVATPIPIYTTYAFSASGRRGFPIREQTLWHPEMPKVTINNKDYRCATVLVRFNDDGDEIAAHTVNQISAPLPGLEFVRNECPSSVPIAAQDNEEYFSVIKNSLSTRNDVNASAIVANYAGVYGISDILAIGYGDPEMQRDITVASRGWSGHIGGRIDVYVKCPLMDAEYLPNQDQVTTEGYDGSGYLHKFIFARYSGLDYSSEISNWIPCDAQPTAPIIFIDWANTIVCGANDFISLDDDGNKYKIDVLPDPTESFWGKNYRYSIYERLEITVKTATMTDGGKTKLAYKTYANLEEIQKTANENRLLNCDLLFKSFIPVYVKELVVVYDENSTLDEDVCAITLANRINGWTGTNGIRFNELFNGIDVPIRFEEVVGEFKYIPDYDIDAETGAIKENKEKDGGPDKMPTYAVLHMDNIDGSQMNYISTRQIYPKTMTGLSATFRTCRYFIDPKDIKFVKSSWLV